jgi:Zn-dependent metalloprotease
VCFIISPRVFQRLIDQETDPKKKDALKVAMAATENLRGQRNLLREHPGAVRSLIRASGATSAAGERSVFDAKKTNRIPGMPVRAFNAAPVADPAVNQAYDNVGITYDFYRQVFQRNSVDDQGLPLLSTVHYGRGFDNAFWNGSQMVYGDGRVFHGFTDALDVIAHELTHGVTQYIVQGTGLNYEGQSGAINESVSDVFGSLVKQWKLGQTAAQADWLIGASLFPAGSGKTLRSMKDPSAGFDPQPATMDQFATMTEDNGGVHINSGIPNHAFYLVATRLGGNAWEKAGSIWYRTLAKVNADADFVAFANASVEAAGSLYDLATKDVVTSAWKDVKVL